MQNPRTSISGYVLLAASVLTLVAHVLTGQFGAGDITLVMSALAGIGLIAAKDGGH